jgi:hypothetical protein
MVSLFEQKGKDDDGYCGMLTIEPHIKSGREDLLHDAYIISLN